MAGTGASLTLVLGGARSGKSRHAEALVTALPPPWTYIATAEAWDDEMRERIAHHREQRGATGWETVEAPLGLTEALDALPDGKPLLLDCLTLWLSNAMLAGKDVEGSSVELADVLSRPRGKWFVVSNEVGYGIVPDTPLGRRFRDAQGRLNQLVAGRADAVILCVAGLPLKVK